MGGESRHRRARCYFPLCAPHDAATHSLNRRCCRYCCFETSSPSAHPDVVFRRATVSRRVDETRAPAAAAVAAAARGDTLVVVWLGPKGFCAAGVSFWPASSERASRDACRRALRTRRRRCAGRPERYAAVRSAALSVSRDFSFRGARTR